MLPNDVRFGQILEPALWLVGALLLAALILLFVQRWQRRSQEPGDPLRDQLTQFRALYEKGEISQEEYERVRGRLLGRFQDKPATTPEPPAGSASPDSPAKSSENGSPSKDAESKS